MTKAKKRILICSIVAALVLSLIYFVFFSGFKMYISYVECSQYDDFDLVVYDFERVATAVKHYGNNRYFLLTTGIKKVGDTQNPKIQFNSDERQSIDRIKSYCYSITHHNLNIVESGENYIMFEYDDSLGCGIVYTTDINSHWGFFSDYGYTKLAKNWYAYYR